MHKNIILCHFGNDFLRSERFFRAKTCVYGKLSIPLHSKSRKHRGVEQLVARQAHNLEVARSSRTPATKHIKTMCFFCINSQFRLPFMLYFFRNFVAVLGRMR